MSNPSTYAETFAQLLNEKFAGGDKWTTNKFTVMAGRKYDRIVQETQEGSHRSVHAFVERATGHVFKSAGWPAPAKGVRFTSVQDAALNADLYGSYLYMH